MYICMDLCERKITLLCEACSGLIAAVKEHHPMLRVHITTYQVFIFSTTQKASLITRYVHPKYPKYPLYHYKTIPLPQ